VGGEGEGPGEFMTVSFVGLLPGDSIVAVDMRQRRYSVFDRGGTFARGFPLSDSFPALAPTTAGILADGRLVVVQPGNFPRGPEDLAGLLGVVRRPDVVSTIARDGSFDARIGEVPGSEVFFGPAPGHTSTGVVFGRGAHVTARGDRIVMATNDEYSLPIHDADARLIQIVRQDRSPAPVQEGDFERAIPPALRPGAPAPLAPMGEGLRALYEEMPRYTTMPPFGSGGAGSAVRFDAEERLWVAEYQVEFGPARGTWQAFDRDGLFLGRLELPERFVVLEFGPDWVLGKQTDEMEVERVLLYGLTAPTPPAGR